jgi:hypothetical protein
MPHCGHCIEPAARRVEAALATPITARYWAGATSTMWSTLPSWFAMTVPLLTAS